MSIRSLIQHSTKHRSKQNSIEQSEIKAFEHWLKHLDSNLSSHAFAILAKALKDVVTLRTSALTQFELIDRIRPHIYRLERELLKDQALHSLNGTPDQKQLQAIDYLWTQLISAYKGVFEHQQGASHERLTNKVCMALCHRQLQAWSRRMELYIKQRANIPAKWWWIVHALFSLGEKNRWTNKNIHDPLFHTMSWSLPYHRMLLLGGSGYAHLSQHQISFLPRLINQLAPHVQLVNPGQNVLRRSQIHHWCLDLSIPKGAHYPGLSETTGKQYPESLRWVVFDEVLDRLKRLHRSHTGLERHLQHMWDRLPNRRRRRQTHASWANFILGLDNLYPILQKNTATPPSVTYSNVQKLKTLNNSASGIALEGEFPHGVRIGELCCFKEPGMSDWSLASICWAARCSVSSSRFQIGIRCLAQNALAGTAQLHNIGQQPSTIYPILQANVLELSPTPLLILPRKIFQPEDRILLNLEGEPEESVIGDPLLTTDRFWIANKQDAFAKGT